MTRVWLQLEGAYRNRAISEICLDALSALEQLTSRKVWSDEKIERSIAKCIEFLKEFRKAAEALHAETASDVFLLRLADMICEKMAVTPEKLENRITVAVDELSRRKASPKTWQLLYSLREVTQKTAISYTKLVSILPPYDLFSSLCCQRHPRAVRVRQSSGVLRERTHFLLSGLF